MSVRRHRRWIAVNALIEIFHIAQQRGIIPSFIVKGGFALEFRFRKEARASRDVDVVVPIAVKETLDALVESSVSNGVASPFRSRARPSFAIIPTGSRSARYIRTVTGQLLTLNLSLPTSPVTIWSRRWTSPPTAY
jgi:hypothetical protein